jgi:hypothetical protein
VGSLELSWSEKFRIRVCWRRGVAFGRCVGAHVRDLAQVDDVVVVGEPAAVGGQEAVEPLPAAPRDSANV